MAKYALKHNLRRADAFTRITVMGLTVLLLWGEVSRVEGGCSSFGHSCFGAHGKRGEIPAGYNPNLDAMAMIAPVGNRISPGGGSPPEVLSESYDTSLLPLNSNNRVSPYLIEWILSARRADGRPLTNANPSSSDDMPTTYRRK